MITSKKGNTKTIIQNMMHIIFWISITLLLQYRTYANNDNLPLREIYWNDAMSDSTLPHSVRIAVIDSLIHNNPKDSRELLSKKAKAYESQLMYKESAKTYEKIWSLSSDLPIRDRLNTLRDWAVSLSMSGSLSGAARKSLDIIQLPKPDSLKILEMDAYIMLAFSKLELGMIENSRPELDKAEKLFEKYKVMANRQDQDEMELLLARANATYYTEIGDYKKALTLMKRAYELSTDELTNLNLAGYIADIYSMAGDFEAAERYYQKVLHSQFAYHNRAVSVCNYMHLLNNSGRYAEALKVLEENISHIPFGIKDMVTSNIIANKADALAALGHNTEAYKLMRNAMVLKDSLNKSFMAGDQLALYELEVEKQHKQEALDKAYELRVCLYVVIVFLFLVCCLSIWTILRWRKERRDNLVTENRIDNVKKEHQIQVESKDNKISTQNRELMTQTLQLAQVNELTNEILAITEANGESDTLRLHKIRERVRLYGMNDNLWEIFRTYFEQTHPDFFKTLYQLHPSLSANEVRMCAYMMLNLTTKEIATLINRSARTVETVKYRLHKKLGLDEESTTAYLHRITGKVSETT